MKVAICLNEDVVAYIKGNDLKSLFARAKVGRHSLIFSWVEWHGLHLNVVVPEVDSRTKHMGRRKKQPDQLTMDRCSQSVIEDHNSRAGRSAFLCPTSLRKTEQKTIDRYAYRTAARVGSPIG